MPSEQDPLREELIDLEVRVAFAQRTVQELDALVRTLYTRVDALEKELALLRAADAGPVIGPANEPPPHY
ncbi:MAG TPA: SlyX family protein [Kofleriaceae bacterium]|nr:SlyX family protein [Kofleriaceae bacterium]